MKVYTSVTYQMTKDGMEEVSSESYEYNGPVAQAGSGGGGTNTIERHYYYDGGPGSQPDISGAVGIEGLVGATGATGATGAAGQPATAPNLNPADTTAGLAPGAMPPSMNPAATPTATANPNAIAPAISYTNPYELMNQMQPPVGGPGIPPKV